MSLAHNVLIALIKTKCQGLVHILRYGRRNPLSKDWVSFGVFFSCLHIKILLLVLIGHVLKYLIFSVGLLKSRWIRLLKLRGLFTFARVARVICCNYSLFGCCFFYLRYTLLFWFFLFLWSDLYLVIFRWFWISGFGGFILERCLLLLNHLFHLLYWHRALNIDPLTHNMMFISKFQH